MPKRVTGGRKSTDSIIGDRLDEQRKALAQAFRAMAETAADQPGFSGRVVVHAAMFDDSLAPSYTPGDLFHPISGARLITSHRAGYLIQIKADRLVDLAEQIERTRRVKELVDISRVQSARFFNEENARGGRERDALWDAAPETENGRAFITWLMPLRDRDAAEHLLEKVAALRDRAISSPPPLLEEVRAALDSSVPAVMRRSLQAAASIRRSDRLGDARLSATGSCPRDRNHSIESSARPAIGIRHPVQDRSGKPDRQHGTRRRGGTEHPVCPPTGRDCRLSGWWMGE